jgi:hypothetical protein
MIPEDAEDGEQGAYPASRISGDEYPEDEENSDMSISRYPAPCEEVKEPRNRMTSGFPHLRGHVCPRRRGHPREGQPYLRAAFSRLMDPTAGETVRPATSARDPRSFHARGQGDGASRAHPLGTRSRARARAQRQEETFRAASRGASRRWPG